MPLASAAAKACSRLEPGPQSGAAGRSRAPALPTWAPAGAAPTPNAIKACPRPRPWAISLRGRGGGSHCLPWTVRSAGAASRPSPRPARPSCPGCVHGDAGLGNDAHSRLIRGGPTNAAVSDVILRMTSQTTERGDLSCAWRPRRHSCLGVGCESEPGARQDSRPSSQASVHSMGAETPASVEEQFSSRAGLGPAGRSKPARLPVSLVLRARVEQDLAPRGSPEQIARLGQLFGEGSPK
jgi:hypothetical protein